MDPKLPLFYIAAITGAIMLIGGIYLLASQKIYIDKATGKRTTKVKLPGIDIESNIPALLYFALGVALTVLPMRTLKELSIPVYEIHGQVRGNSNSQCVSVYALAEQSSVYGNGPFSLVVPRLSKPYTIVYICNADVISGDTAPPTNQLVELGIKEMNLPVPTKYEGKVDPPPAEFE